MKINHAVEFGSSFAGGMAVFGLGALVRRKDRSRTLVYLDRYWSGSLLRSLEAGDIKYINSCRRHLMWPQRCICFARRYNSVLAGKHDNVLEIAFYMAGSMDHVLEKATELKIMSAFRLHITTPEGNNRTFGP